MQSEKPERGIVISTGPHRGKIRRLLLSAGLTHAVVFAKAEEEASQMIVEEHAHEIASLLRCNPYGQGSRGKGAKQQRKRERDWGNPYAKS